LKRTTVAKVSEIPPGARRIIVPWKGQAGIGVFNLHGSFYAIRNLCPHRLGPLCTGQLGNTASRDWFPGSDPPAMASEGMSEVIRCPWHLWEFDIKTGQCLVDPSVRVKTYPVTIQDGSVVVECDHENDPATSSESEQDA